MDSKYKLLQEYIKANQIFYVNHLNRFFKTLNIKL